MNADSNRSDRDAAAEKVAARAGDILQKEVAALDAATLSKLNQARQRALAEKPGAGKDLLFGWSALGGMVAASLLIAVLWLGSVPENPGVETPLAVDTSPLTLPDANEMSVSDLEVLLAEESFEMLEDLDFYTWVESAAYEDATDEGFVG